DVPESDCDSCDGGGHGLGPPVQHCSFEVEHVAVTPVTRHRDVGCIRAHMEDANLKGSSCSVMRKSAEGHGPEIDGMTEPALGHVAEQTTVFARVTPMQKLRILRALRQRGHVVGYIGEGINDAPSLHAADVGISVATAVDVARDAADIILLRPGL